MADTTATGTTLRAGRGIAEITPPLEVGLLMSSAERRWAPFEGVRLPLHARALVIEQGSRRLGLVSLDLLGLADSAVGGMAQFKARIEAHAGGAVKAEDLVLTSTHTHTGPETIALTDIPQTTAFRAWVDYLARQIGAALAQAAKSMRSCRLGVAAGTIAGLGIYRRIKTTEGIAMSHPPPDPAKVISRDGPLDEGVRVAALVDGDGKPLAIVVNATCHPVHEMCNPQVSPDYPGEMCRDLERRFPGAMAMFLNGAAGNTNPPVVCGGAENARRHGVALAAKAAELMGSLRFVEGTLSAGQRSIELPAKPGRPPVTMTLNAWAMGDAAMVFVPGELFVEIGLDILRGSPFAFTALAGYAGDDYVGYLPTDKAFEEGGYEVGPGDWAKVGKGTEALVRGHALALLGELRATRA